MTKKELKRNGTVSVGKSPLIAEACSLLWRNFGKIDNNKVLLPKDDVAHVKWGGNWRMPTSAEVTELLENCTITPYQHPTISAERGLVLTSKKNGNSIFFARRTEGFYWTSSIYDGWNVFANAFETNATKIVRDSYRRYTIRKIRAVCK